MPFRLVPPTTEVLSLTGFRWTRCVPFNTRCTGRPRPIPGTVDALGDKVLRRDVLWRACGPLSLNGTVVAPRANKPWREKPNAGGERRR